LEISISPTSRETGARAARRGAALIRDAIATKGEACIILATGASQFDLLDALVADGEIDWPRVTIFHLDEYIGIDETHPASFVRYLKERFLSRVPGVGEFVFIDGNASDMGHEIARVSQAINRVAIDVAFVGIGENGHLAFNDPPADFATTKPYIRVDLDQKCRQQQANEGWFDTVDDVPKQAVSMSIRQIMKSAAIICTVPDARKSQAAQWTIEGEVSNLHPASVLQDHPAVFMFLDTAAAAGLGSGIAG